VPTIEFLSWRGAVRGGHVPVVAAEKLKRVRMIVHAELAAIVLILLCAAIMAKGGWHRHRRWLRFSHFDT